MNIKNLLGNSASIAPVANAAKAERPIKMDSSHDRDPSGGQYSQQEKKKEKMTEEQFSKAIAILREKNFIKDMNWVVTAVYENDVKYVWVQDSNGHSIRKIIEFDLWEVFDDTKPEETKGQLLKRSA
ncbi:MAG: hypothetical protein AABY53_05800 [Bdellovibrionota bacterium]